MSQPAMTGPRLSGFPRILTVLAFLLALITAGVLWRVPLIPPILPVPAVALFGLLVLGLLCFPHLRAGVFGEMFPLELTASSMTLNDESVSVVFARNVSKRKQAQRYLTAHYAATCILAEAPSLTEALPRILQAICEALRVEAGAFWQVDPDAG